MTCELTGMYVQYSRYLRTFQSYTHDNAPFKIMPPCTWKSSLRPCPGSRTPERHTELSDSFQAISHLATRHKVQHIIHMYCHIY